MGDVGGQSAFIDTDRIAAVAHIHFVAAAFPRGNNLVVSGRVFAVGEAVVARRRDARALLARRPGRAGPLAPGRRRVVTAAAADAGDGDPDDDGDDDGATTATKASGRGGSPSMSPSTSFAMTVFMSTMLATPAVRQL